MKQPEEFQLIKQPEGSMLAGACVCAMAVGKTLNQVLADYDWRKLMDWCGQQSFFGDHEVITSEPHLLKVGAFMLSPHEMKEAVGEVPALVGFESATFEGISGLGLWTGAKLLDPAWKEQERYGVLCVRYLTYMGDTNYLEFRSGNLDADWRKAKPENFGLRAKDSDTFVSEA